MDRMTQQHRGSIAQERILMVAFVVVALVAIAGFVIISMQERGRTRLVAEYQAYQFATMLVQEGQNNPALDYDKIDDLVAFGMYGYNGEALVRTALAPSHIAAGAMSEQVSFLQNRIRLTFRVGGGFAAPDPHLGRGTQASRGMPGNPMMSRYFYIDYSAPALSQRLPAGALAGALGGVALLLAFGLIVVLYRRLESYKAIESKNRQLTALEGASRSLADEIKNPLATIMLRCGLIKKRFGEAGSDEALAIEAETNRIARLVDRIRESLISGEDWKSI